jgi:hypothetical protein
MKEVSKIEKAWILEIAGHYYEDKTKQVISERQLAEIANNEKIEKISQINEKTSISNVLSKRAEEKFGGNLSFSTKRNPNRIYMEVDKNKGDEYYFDELDNHIIEVNQPKFTKKPVQIPEKVSTSNTTEPTQDDEELDNITLLRRMRNRVNK